jgi:hypothetical protein
MTPWREVAELAYAAYGTSVNWTTVQGDPMPRWEDLPERLHVAWEAASVAAHAAATLSGL